MVVEQAEVDANNWAIVVYQPPMIGVQVVEISVVAIPFGPPLPPEMVWRRSFEKLLEAPAVFEMPKPLLFQHVSPVTLSKRNWDFAFRQDDLPLLTWKEQEPAKPVARVLFSDDVEKATPVDAVSTPIVSTKARSPTRLWCQLLWWKPLFEDALGAPFSMMGLSPLSMSSLCSPREISTKQSPSSLRCLMTLHMQIFLQQLQLVVCRQ